MGRRLKEMTERFNEKQAEVNLLNERIDRLEAQVAEYVSRESAVALTLVEARGNAEKIKADAKLVVDGQYAAARLALEEARAKAIAIENEARSNAASIIAAAEADAKRRTEEAESELDEYRMSLDSLNAQLVDAASAAKKQSDAFAAMALGLKSDVTEDAEAECGVIGRKSVEVDMPEDYASPAELMRSIYAIQNRPLPSQSEEKADEDEVFTLADIIGEEPVPVAEKQPAVEDKPEDEAKAFCEPGCVVTVDEVVAAGMDAPSVEVVHHSDDIDKELDRLIQDVLGED